MFNLIRRLFPRDRSMMVPREPRREVHVLFRLPDGTLYGQWMTFKEFSALRPVCPPDERTRD